MRIEIRRLRQVLGTLDDEQTIVHTRDLLDSRSRCFRMVGGLMPNALAIASAVGPRFKSPSTSTSRFVRSQDPEHRHPYAGRCQEAWLLMTCLMRV